MDDTDLADVADPRGTGAPAATDDIRAQQLALEQRSVNGMYARLDQLRAAADRALREVRAAGASGTPQARSERDAFATLHENRLAQLDAAEDRLCFGRIDLETGESHHIGRLGLSDREQRQLLVDWRAPAARPFYQATAVDRFGAILRRHLTTVGRRVTHVEDDVLDLDALRDSGAVALSGEGALLAALKAGRTGRMSDIVGTIQVEQDRIIRGDLPGVMVVQGGPGTGKTAVALHRAAYLLYTHRDRLERAGVLLVGPSDVFLRYIDQVLPSLGETGVVTTTIGGLLPGVRTERHDAPAVAAVKGSARMARVLRAAVAGHQRVPTGALHFSVRGVELRLRTRSVVAARDSARGSGQPHNLARERFLLQLLDELARQLARGLRLEPTRENRQDLLVELREQPDVRRELNLLWLPLTPQRVLAGLLPFPDRIAEVTPGWSGSDRDLLHRADGTAWTVDDVPLLDELAELLGEDDARARRAERAAGARRQTELEHARSVLSMGLTAPGRLTAEELADRWEQTGPNLTVAERAQHDRTWTYGHIVVDEAQELSAMAWRALLRRCPRRSMTLVGDLAQSSALEPARGWGDVLDPLLAGRWRAEELTISYRTPEQIMTVAAAVLAASGSELTAPTSVRLGDWEPTAHRVGQIAPAELREVLAAELELRAGGRIALVLPRPGTAGIPDPAELADGLATLLPGTGIGAGPGALEQPVAVLTVEQVKGLEFDAVVLCEPAAMLTEDGSGWGDLYVALTRPTQRLRVVHARSLPRALRGLAGTDTVTP
ncbi:MAG TPA: AAA family ATPase [Candidatus Nanopelagicales bacterium]|nr:AAA family ATPase [Candidatus Nanopelagicales bacterium]